MERDGTMEGGGTMAEVIIGWGLETTVEVVHEESAGEAG